MVAPFLERITHRGKAEFLESTSGSPGVPCSLYLCGKRFPSSTEEWIP